MNFNQKIIVIVLLVSKHENFKCQNTYSFRIRKKGGTKIPIGQAEVDLLYN